MENTSGRSSLNIFYILYVLYSCTDENHMFTVNDIVQRAQTLCNVAISDDTVGRLLNGLMSEVFLDQIGREETEKLKAKYGFCIRRKKAGKAYLYYYDHSLSDGELQTLIDAVESYGYFSTEEIQPLINKIMRLRKAAYGGRRYIDDAREERIITEDAMSLLDKIRILLRAIRNDHKIRITYCYYDYRKQLVPRAGYPREVQPMALLWSNGYYYLQSCFENHSNIVNLRIDRITEIEELEEKREFSAESESRGSSVEYRNRHPVMYSGEIRAITLLCRTAESNFLCNKIIDTFGKECRMQPAGDADLKKYLGHDREYYASRGEQWLIVHARASLGGTELWATQRCKDCVVVAPQELREQVERNLRSAMENYGAGEPVEK